MPIEILYEHGSKSAEELSDAVDQVLRELQATGEIAEGGGDEQISITENSANLDPETVQLIVTFAGPVFVDLWHRIILPRLERELGTNAVGSEVERDEKPE